MTKYDINSKIDENNKIDDNKIDENKINENKIDENKIDENNKISFNIKNNFSRQIKNYLRKFIDFKKIKGLIYYNLHFLFIFIILFITLFSTSTIKLIILLIIITLEGISIVYLHGCPLTMLEKKYLGYDSCEERDNYLKQMNISYNCEHTYEKQMEIIIDVWCIIAMKCLIIIFLNMFNIKLNDPTHIYS